MSRSETSLVELEAAHLPLLAALHAACFPEEPWSEAALGALLAMPGCFGLLLSAEAADLAEATGLATAAEPAAFIIVRQAADEAEIITFGVAPALRRRGLGGRILAIAQRRLVEAGVRRLLLEVAADNSAGLALYEHFDFVTLAKRPDYYTQGRKCPIDALLLACDLQI